jgi:hypothetical protein
LLLLENGRNVFISEPDNGEIIARQVGGVKRGSRRPWTPLVRKEFHGA